MIKRIVFLACMSVMALTVQKAVAAEPFNDLEVIYGDLISIEAFNATTAVEVTGSRKIESLASDTGASAKYTLDKVGASPATMTIDGAANSLTINGGVFGADQAELVIEAGNTLVIRNGGILSLTDNSGSMVSSSGLIDISDGGV